MRSGVTTDLATECRTFVAAVKSLLEVEATLHPERRTAHLVDTANRLLVRLERERDAD